MKENERRRKRTSIDMDPEMSQYLEDERLAIMLQNSEFLQELRGNDDFMQTLQRGGCGRFPFDSFHMGKKCFQGFPVCQMFLIHQKLVNYCLLKSIYTNAYKCVNM